MDTDKNKTVVIFRKFKIDGDIIALFPAEKWGIYSPDCMCYQHLGQHGAADYNYCLSITVLATPDEYNDLKQELESIGYNLKVQKRYMRSR